MTAIDTTRSASGFSVSAVVFGLFDTVTAWNNARITRKSLSALTDRQLEDIGLCRGDIEGVATAH